ncbi:hypothetical protein J2X32_001677 [Rheinheimera pacifica]|uniref:hypothetical protein n=1 Tax=Rheinheimera pacifica TaxID=173990 RepID=UPI00286750AF|nr:hypothetical protein [Rheinheimera pacifica]MDR6983043.1 hypothetical protein [Rheinheimera pacifica]
MQELTFEQVDVVSGGSKIEDGRRRQAEREARDHTLNSDVGGGGGAVNNLGAQTVIIGIGTALGAINPWLGVAGAMYSYYVVSAPSSGGSPSYPSYQGGPHQVDPLL